VIHCDATLHRGEEMGWFEHGSTIIVFAPPGLSLADGVQEGALFRMGEALLRDA
jgi:phosphatidylserine decarboxylase